MPENNPRKIIPARIGVMNDLTDRIKLILRLLGDKRVSPLLKLIPIGALVYLVWPLDLMIGPLDDAAVLWLGTYLFVELCPAEVVQEHTANIRKVIPGNWSDPAPRPPDEDIVEAEYREVS